MENVKKVQAGYKVQTLSTYLKEPASPAAPVIDFPPINKELVKTHFFELLNFALQFAPPQPNEAEVRAKLARLGIGIGKKFDCKSLPLGRRAAILIGMKQGSTKIDQEISSFGKDINGWGAKVAEAMPIAKPTRASSKHIFIVWSSGAVPATFAVLS
jgi:hypothetical protein